MGAFIVITVIVLPILILVLLKRDYVFFIWGGILYQEAQGEMPDKRRNILERSCRWFEKVRQKNLSEKALELCRYYWARSIREFAFLESDEDQRSSLLKEASGIFKDAASKSVY